MSKKIKPRKILLFGDECLRKACTSVVVFNRELHDKLDIARQTLTKNKGGAALAAPQIFILKRFIVIDYLGEYLELINPLITERSGEVESYEGCLSFPGYIGKVKRSKYVKVSYQDRTGAFNEIERTGEMAKCIEHEIDHLDGILYIDRILEDFVYNPETDAKVSVKDLLFLTQKEFK